MIRTRFIAACGLLIAACGTTTSSDAENRTAKAAAATHLMFQGGVAEAALHFYGKVFPGFRLRTLDRYGPEGPGPEDSIRRVDAELYGHRLIVVDSPVKHAFEFTPSVSLFVEMPSEAELDAAFAALSEGGRVFMPLGDYGFSRRFGWCADRFGVSWQLNLSAPSPDAVK